MKEKSELTVAILVRALVAWLDVAGAASSCAGHGGPLRLIRLFNRKFGPCCYEHTGKWLVTCLGSPCISRFCELSMTLGIKRTGFALWIDGMFVCARNGLAVVFVGSSVICYILSTQSLSTSTTQILLLLSTYKI